MVNPIAWQFNLFGLWISIHWYGVIIAVGLLLAILLAMYHAKREGHDPDNILDLALIVIPLAVICARIYYVIFQWHDTYSKLPFWEVFAIWKGGLAIYGGVIGGFLGILIYSRFVNRKFGLIDLLDIAAPSLILGQAIGRWGNFVNNEAYGYIVNNPAWQWFPAAVKIYEPSGQFSDNLGMYNFHMATFFYESIWNLLVFAFLFFYFKNYKKRKPGDVLWFYLLLYGLGRTVIEGLRTDSLYIAGTEIRVSQWLSILLAVVSACMLLAPFAKKTLAAYRERRTAMENAPLDESLRLKVDPEEEKDKDAKDREPVVQPGGKTEDVKAAKGGKDEKKEG